MPEGSDEWQNYLDVANLLHQLFPDSEVRNLMLQIISSGLIGHIENFFCFNGSGGNLLVRVC